MLGVAFLSIGGPPVGYKEDRPPQSLSSKQDERGAADTAAWYATKTMQPYARRGPCKTT